jgi:undecaprenyl-phosphate 4-deoxy-4-formamido-L-arabinose transferase
VITIDDDLEHPPEVVPELCGKASAGWDAVFALPSGVAKTGGVFRDLFFTLFLGKPRGLRISSYRILSRKAVDVISAARGRSVYISAELFRRGFAAACLFYDKTGGITTRSRYGGAARIRLYLKLFRNYAPLIRRLGTAPSTAGQYEIASSGGIL